MTARWPTSWPRMKLRGARRKRLAAERNETNRMYMPIARPTVLADGSISFVALSTPEPGAVAIFAHKLTDGFGRPVKKRTLHDNHQPKAERATRVPDHTPGGYAVDRKVASWGASVKFTAPVGDFMALLRGA